MVGKPIPDVGVDTGDCAEHGEKRNRQKPINRELLQNWIESQENRTADVGEPVIHFPELVILVIVSGNGCQED